MDGDTAMNPHTLQAALRAAGAVLLAKANLLRSHEVARVQPVLDMLEICAS